MDALSRRLVILRNDATNQVLIKQSIESSRYHPSGATRLKKRIHTRLNSYPAENGLLLTLTIADRDSEQESYQGLGRVEAWCEFGYRKRYFLDRVNKLRKSHGLPRVKRRIATIEEQHDRHYPHTHIWFPGLKYLAKIEDIQKLWPWGNVDLKVIDNMTPANYIIKYISKMEGKGFMQAMLWYFRLRLFTTTRDFKYIYELKPDNGWKYEMTGEYFRAKEKAEQLTADGYEILGSELIQPRGS